MTHASLFSGIGGAELAASWMGWANLFHCEINPFGRKVLEYHFPNSISYEDVTKTDFSKWQGQVDVLTAGFPCQPFSVAGQRKGSDDDRYLWPEVVRVIREVRPTWVVGENVAGILTMVQPGKEVEMGSQTSIFGEDNRKRILFMQEYVVETVCRDLEREGYSVQPVVIPACAVGAPHRRDRVWFIANRTDTGTEGMQRTGKDSIHATGTVTDTDIYRCGERTDEQEHIFRSKRTSNNSTCGKNGVSADTKCSRRDEMDNQIQSEKSYGERDYRNGDKRHVAYTDSFGCDNGGNNREMRQVRENLRRSTEENKPERYKWKFGIGTNGTNSSDTSSNRLQRAVPPYTILPSECFAGFPTQSPVCSRDDGLSSRLDGITFSKWRQESIKAYGNAWVPQVAYEIFKAIEESCQI